MTAYEMRMSGWSSCVFSSDLLTLVLADLGFTGSLGTVTGLQGSVALSRIDPPATPPGQLLTATAVDVGVPVVAPRIRFRLEPESVLRLESVEATLADGRVTAADVAITLGGAPPVPGGLTRSAGRRGGK